MKYFQESILTKKFTFEQKLPMQYERYEYSSEHLMLFYEFVSEGPNGKIKKVVEYVFTGVENVYNLAFGDFDEQTGGTNDKSVTNNGDTQKVLATVAATLDAFTGKYPEAIIYATGSTKARTRLYRIGITNNLIAILKDFHVFGLTANDDWEPFVAGNHYEAFLVTRKIRNFNL